MKNLLFKYKNGKFVMTEGYGSVKEADPEPTASEIPANTLSGIMKKNNIENKASAEKIINIVSSWLGSNGITPDESKLIAGLEVYDEAEVEEDPIDKRILPGEEETDADSDSSATKANDDESEERGVERDEIGDKSAIDVVASDIPTTGWSSTVKRVGKDPSEKTEADLEIDNIHDDPSKQTEKSLQINIVERLGSFYKEFDKESDYGKNPLPEDHPLNGVNVSEYLTKQVGISNEELMKELNQMSAEYEKLQKEGNILKINFNTKLNKNQLQILLKSLENVMVNYKQHVDDTEKLTKPSKSGFDNTGKRINPDLGSRDINISDDEIELLRKAGKIRESKLKRSKKLSRVGRR